MIEDYLNQTVILYRPVGKTGHGDILYDAGTTTKARVTGKNRLIQSITGELIQAEYIIWTVEALDTNDRIFFNDRNWVILSAQGHPGLEGNIEYWEASVNHGNY